MINFVERDATIEYSAVGAMLIDSGCIDAALAIVGADDFTNPLCRTAVQAIIELRAEAKPIDAVIAFNRAKQLNDSFTYEFAAECMKICGSAANIEEYCRLIKAASDTEKIAKLADSINNDVFNRKSPDSIISKLRQELDDINLGASSAVMDSKSAADAWSAHDEKVKADPEGAYCKTGFNALDIVLGGGMFNAGLYIIGARPGMGKTTLGIGIAENIADRDKPVLFVSLEMSRVQIMAKRIARKSGLGYTQLMTGVYRGTELHRAIETNDRLSKAPFFLSDKSLCRVSDIETMAHSIKNLSCIVIDYFGLLTAEENSDVKSRYEEMTDISKALKGLAKRLDIPLLVLCQLNRENASRSDKRPKLSDLRDTGALEQDADCVILLHRENYYEQSEEAAEKPEIEFIELNVAKNRHGETRICKMMWNGFAGRISETSNRDDEPPFYSVDNADDLPF